jgi:hypothetical protein
MRKDEATCRKDSHRTTRTGTGAGFAARTGGSFAGPRVMVYDSGDSAKTDTKPIV